MVKKSITILLLFLPVSLSSQNLDIRILCSINSAQTLSSDKYFQFISNSNAYLVIAIPVGMGAAGLIKHNNELFRNACVTLTATAWLTHYINKRLIIKSRSR